MKIEELPRASEGDTIELEGKVFRLKEPNSNDFDGEIVWGQFIVLKDSTGEQGCWLKLDSKEDSVTKGTQISINGKLGKEYTEKRSGKLKRSINNCDFEIIGKMQEPAQSTSQSGGTKDNYWEKKFKYEVERDPKVQLAIARQCAIKAVTEMVGTGNMRHVEVRKWYFDLADKIVDYIYNGQDGNKKITSEAITEEFGGNAKEEKKETKEERTKKAKDIVGKTEFKPASEKQKNVIFGHRNKDGWHKGIIESRYIEQHEIQEIGDPKKLSVDKAGEWITFWWGDQSDPDDIGARKQREKENPRDENGKLVNALVKGDKKSLVKEVLIDDINALRRENFLNDDVKFEDELGYSPKLENFTEKELTTIKGLLKNYHPKDWDEK